MPLAVHWLDTHALARVGSVTLAAFASSAFWGGTAVCALAPVLASNAAASAAMLPPVMYRLLHAPYPVRIVKPPMIISAHRPIRVRVAGRGRLSDDPR